MGDPNSYQEASIPSTPRPTNYSWAEVVVIPEGATVEVNDSDWPVVKICQLKMEANSVLKVNCTSALGGSYFGFGYGQLIGSGTVEKTSSFLLLQSAYNGAFTGDWVIDQGGFGIISNNDAGGSRAGGSVVIRSGAWFDCSLYSNYRDRPDFTIGQKTIHLAGDGAGLGALVASAYATFNKTTYKRVVLDADTSISSYKGGFGLVGTEETPGLLDLNGHDLYVQGAKYDGDVRETSICLENMLVTNSVPTSGGRIVLGGPNSRTHVLQVRNGVTFDKNVTVMAQKGGSVTVYVDAGMQATEVGVALHAVVGGTVVSISPLTSGALAGSVNWTGDVKIPEGMTLDAPGGIPGEAFSFAGNLTGSGTLKIKNQNAVSLLGDNSAFDGKVNLDDMYNWTGLRLGAPASAPANITVAGSTLVVPFPAWSFSEYLTLANAVTYSDSGVYLPSVTIDPSGCPGGTYEMSLKDGDLTNPKAVLGIGGEGMVEVKELPETGASRFAAWAGTLKFAMNEPIALGTMLATSFRDAPEPGKIVFDGVPEIDIAQNCFWIGTPYLVEANAKGEVTVRNSMLHNAGTKPLADQEGFYVGNAGFGKLVFEDSVVTSRVHVGTETNGVGEVLVKGGSFHHTSGGNSDAVKDMMIVGYKGHGYAELDKTAAEVTGYVAVGYEGSGVMVQKGGTCNLRISPSDTETPAQLQVGRQKGGTARRAVGQFRLTDGGKFSCTHETWLAAIGNTGSYDHYTYGTLTIDGVGSYYSCGPFGIGEAAQSTGIVNLNDKGTLYAKTFRGSSAGRAGKSYVNFNGGIYDHRCWGETYLFGLSPDAAKEGDRSVTKVTVYGKGATIISSASQKDRKFGQPIHNATGKGVGSIPWTDTTRVFCGAPAVIVEGDGTGASAMAEYDPVTGTVTNILVTSPGCDYETATAYLVQGPVTNAVIDLTSSLVENDKNGPVEFRHTNNGSFTFDVANDYIGETILSSAFQDGAFNITNKDAFAKSKAIKVKSGVLYLANYTLDDLTAPFKFMGGTIKGDASTYVVPEGKMVVDLKDIVAGETYDMTKNTNLTLPSSIALWNAEGLDESVKYPLLKLPQNYAGVLPTFTGVPTNWHVSRTATGFRLSRDRASVLILR